MPKSLSLISPGELAHTQLHMHVHKHMHMHIRQAHAHAQHACRHLRGRWHMRRQTCKKEIVFRCGCLVYWMILGLGPRGPGFNSRSSP